MKQDVILLNNLSGKAEPSSLIAVELSKAPGLKADSKYTVKFNKPLSGSAPMASSL